MDDPNTTSTTESSTKNDELHEDLEKLSPIVAGYSLVVSITTLGFELVALLLLGRFVDVRYGWEPWGLIVGAVIGAYVFITGLISIVERLNKQNSRKR